MTDTNEQKLDETEGIELEEIEEVQDESGQDITDWKGTAQKNHGMAKRYKSDFQKTKKEFDEYKSKHPEVEVEKPAQDKKEDKKDFDLAEKSYLLANGIKKDQISLYWEESKKTGLSIDDLMASPYFQEKLEKLSTADATPFGVNRTGSSAKDSVDYWVNKVKTTGQFPPNTPENFELRKKIVERLAQIEKKGNKFTSQPIV